MAREFEPGVRMMIARAADVAGFGLAYRPHYALSRDEVDALARGELSWLPHG